MMIFSWGFALLKLALLLTFLVLPFWLTILGIRALRKYIRENQEFSGK